MVYKANGLWFIDYDGDTYGPYGSEAHAIRVLAGFEREKAQKENA